ncbi:MAG: prevent-host-death protein [Erythrobacter sp.]|nr:prevent-host-death protein [Erythrobacter sp.]MBA4082424.1 prevent-host-death protein [Erythrobacter sp.]
MDVISYSEARKNLKSVMDKVVADHSEAIITRRNGEAVVMVSLSEWNSILETEHLLRSPENARRLRESIAQLDRGEVVERDLIQP